MLYHETPLPGVIVIDLQQIKDERGFFARSWCAEQFASRGLSNHIVQINTAHNALAGTLRGLHYQREPCAEVKVVHCPYGAVFDVALDLRPISPTFRRWYGLELNGDNHRALYIPEGCAHGYITLRDNSGLTYTTSHRYEPTSATGVRFDDPEFAISWPITPTIVSAADRGWAEFRSSGST